MSPLNAGRIAGAQPYKNAVSAKTCPVTALECLCRMLCLQVGRGIQDFMVLNSYFDCVDIVLG